MAGRVIATNKKAYHNYFLGEKWECGIVLQGAEVKSIRAGEVNFKDSFARLEDGEVFLHHLHVNPYPQAAVDPPDPDRVRKLLLNKREIKKIATQLNERGKALVPTRIYFNPRGLVKVEIAVGQGKKLFDKRETLKKREMERALKRTLLNTRPR